MNPAPEYPDPVREAPPAVQAVSVRLPAQTPFITYGLLGGTSLVFLAQLASAQVTGYDLPTLFGMKVNEWIRAGEYWRLVTPIFLHANPTHIFFNMFALFQIGPQVERLAGRLRFFLLYMLSGVAGVVLSYWLSPATSVGASGAIFGSIGALAVFLFRHRRLLGPAGKSMLTNVAVFIGINLAISFMPGIDLWAHFGGLVAGSVLMLLGGPHLTVERDDASGQPALQEIQPFRRTWPLFLLAALVLAFLAILPANI